jgi:hypothetical protein
MARPWGDNFRKPTRSEEGHEFEHLWRRRIYEKFKNWKSVTMRIGKQQYLLTAQNVDSKAKGVDLLIDVKAKNAAAGRRAANKIIKTLQEMNGADDV